MLKTSDKNQLNLNTSPLSLTSRHSHQEDQTGYHRFQCFVVFRLGSNATTKRCCLGIKFTLFSKYYVITCCQQCLSQAADYATLARILFQCRAKINHPCHHVATKYEMSRV